MYGGWYTSRIHAIRREALLGDDSGYGGILDDIKSALSTAYDVVKSGITSVPGAQAAIDYVKEKVGEFFQLPARIRRASERSRVLLSAAQTKGLNTEAAELVGVQGALASAKGTYDSTESKLTGLLDAMKSAGFGALPVALLAVAVAVAAAMAYLFKTVSFNESVLDKIERKVLTPAEAASLFGAKPLLGFEVPWYVWLLGGGGAFYYLVRKRGRTG